MAKCWNQLIERALNKNCEYPWLTPMQNSFLGDNYDYLENPHYEERISHSNHRGTPMTKGWKTQEGRKYELVASKKMVGIFISVWVRQEVLKKYYVSNAKVSSVACGIMGCLGNKGSVAVSMSIEGTSFCFVVAHLAAGEKKGDAGRRNHQVSEIFRRTNFPRTTKDHYPHPSTILGHE